MLNVKVVLIVIVGLFFDTPVNASPTSNEFISCKKLAVATLEYCLKDDDNNCWTKSKTSYNLCRKDVIKTHVPDYEKIKLERKVRYEIDRKR